MSLWVTAAAVMSLQASLSLAADLPGAVTRTDLPDTDAMMVLLGRDLSFDPILPGNRNTSCASYHHSPPCRLAYR